MPTYGIALLGTGAGVILIGIIIVLLICLCCPQICGRQKRNQPTNTGSAMVQTYAENYPDEYATPIKKVQTSYPQRPQRYDKVIRNAKSTQGNCAFILTIPDEAPYLTGL